MLQIFLLTTIILTLSNRRRRLTIVKLPSIDIPGSQAFPEASTFSRVKNNLLDSFKEIKPSTLTSSDRHHEYRHTEPKTGTIKKTSSSIKTMTLERLPSMEKYIPNKANVDKYLERAHIKKIDYSNLYFNLRLLDWRLSEDRDSNNVPIVLVCLIDKLRNLTDGFNQILIFKSS